MTTTTKFYSEYAARLSNLLIRADWSMVELLGKEMFRCWEEKKQVFICGNGGSSGNANHLANDYLYGIAKKTGEGLRVNSLSSNPSVLTCLGNDLGYEKIYSEQIATLANKRDLLVVLTGSGNSPNIIKAVQMAKKMELVTCGILGYTGGLVKDLVDIPIHFNVNDMQIAEDTQLIVGHMLMQWLYKKHVSNNGIVSSTNHVNS